ncbi:MAG: hypothetical protein WC364_13545 [Eubacteriales bacterium]|jgi:hypothetical protein
MYYELPVKWKRRFEQFTIRIFRITDYLPEEPGELFFRLNQPTNLTAAEQRNAFYGPAREQVKMLVKHFEQYGLSKNVLGFSNSRMAYDDIIAKLCYCIDNGSLLEKITSSRVTNKYRSKEYFKDGTIKRVDKALMYFSESIAVSP